MSGPSERHLGNQRPQLLFSPDVTHQSGGEFGIEVDQTFDNLLDLLRTSSMMTGHSPQVVRLTMHRLQLDRACKGLGGGRVLTKTSVRETRSVARTIKRRLAAKRLGKRRDCRTRTTCLLENETMVVMQVSIVRRQAQTIDVPFRGHREVPPLGGDARQMSRGRQIVGPQTMGDQILGKRLFLAPEEAPQPGPGIMSSILEIHPHSTTAAARPRR